MEGVVGSHFTGPKATADGDDEARVHRVHAERRRRLEATAECEVHRVAGAIRYGEKRRVPAISKRVKHEEGVLLLVCVATRRTATPRGGEWTRIVARR